MHEHVVRFEVALVSELSVTNVTSKLWLDSTFILYMSDQVTLLLVRQPTLRTHKSVMVVFLELNIPEN